MNIYTFTVTIESSETLTATELESIKRDIYAMTDEPNITGTPTFWRVEIQQQ